MAAPHFTDRVEEALSIVVSRSESPELPEDDRGFLAEALGGLSRAIISRGADEQLLHGEPHAGNLLRTSAGMRFIDLETCCYGPVGFDLAHAPVEVGDHYPLADPTLLRDCRLLTLAMVAAWRSERDDRFPHGRSVRAELIKTLREARAG